MNLFPRRTISEDDLVDLRGKVAVVTGANTGVGYGTAQFLVRKGAKVYIASRNEARVSEAIDRLKSEGVGDGTLVWLNLDLSDPRLAKRAAEELLEKEERLDILVNNAAIGLGPFSLDKDGLLDIMVTNHISHYTLTRTLLPLLKKTAAQPDSDVRIVNVSTAPLHIIKTEIPSYSSSSLNKDYGNSFGCHLDTYGHTKLANILHINELQRTLDATHSNITCLSVHPGTIKTRGSDAFLDRVPYFTTLAKMVGGLFFGPWRNGGMSVAWAAAGREIALSRESYRGRYVEPVAVVATPSKEARDERLAKELWDSTEEVLKELSI
ncbi:NAD-P-binding protein [Panaeolus papilionaceus]|nr:NAD-P-binding protein [Panaeolus papilionaceus]